MPMIQTWWGKVRTRRSLGHLVVLPKASTAVKTIFVVAKTLVVLFNYCVNISMTMLTKNDCQRRSSHLISQLWKLGSSIRWISIASFFMTFVLWDQIFKLHSIFSLLSSYFDQFCIFRPSDAFFILCNILKRRSYAKVPLVGASSCDTYLTIDNWH